MGRDIELEVFGKIVEVIIEESIFQKKLYQDSNGVTFLFDRNIENYFKRCEYISKIQRFELDYLQAKIDLARANIR